MSRQNRTVIIALGGNALSPKEEAGTIDQQFQHTRESLKAVMHFVKLDYNICITHGNGPQVGAELSKNEIAMDIIPPLPLNFPVFFNCKFDLVLPSNNVLPSSANVLFSLLDSLL